MYFPWFNRHLQTLMNWQFIILKWEKIIYLFIIYFHLWNSNQKQFSVNKTIYYRNKETYYNSSSYKKLSYHPDVSKNIIHGLVNNSLITFKTIHGKCLAPASLTICKRSSCIYNNYQQMHCKSHMTRYLINIKELLFPKFKAPRHNYPSRIMHQ